MRNCLRAGLKILIPILVVVTGGILAYLHGWRLFGFRYCQPPASIVVQDVRISDGDVTITGCTTDSATKFIGYRYDFKNGKLRIGLKFGLFAGKSGDFTICIKEDKVIEEIVITGGGKEEGIYPTDA